jgi:hypothetical protein
MQAVPMLVTTQAGVKFVYTIPIPFAARALAATTAVALFAILFGIPLIDLGTARMVETFRSDSVAWTILSAMDGSLIGFFMVLAFLPRSWRAGLEFGQDRVRLIPRPILRWIDEPSSIDMAFGARMQEILICHGTRNSSPFGFRVILRAAGVPDREFKVETGDDLNAREVKMLTDGIIAATGIPVRLIERKTRKDGTVREGIWIPAGKPFLWMDLARVLAVALPFASGGLVGELRPSYAGVAIAAIAVWSLQSSGVLLFNRLAQKQRKFTASKWLLSFFNFALEYATTFAFVTFVLRRH